MKKLVKVVILALVLTLNLNIFVNAQNTDINIYEEEKVFEFKNKYISIDDKTELKLNTNLDINSDDLAWTVSDAKIATIKNGVIEPLNNGKVIVKVEYLPLNLKATCEVNVKYVVNGVNIKVGYNSYNSLKISYNKQANATHYEIQRSTKKNGKYTTIATTTSTSYIDKNLTCGATYYYKVRAVNKNNGIKSGYSKIASSKVVPAKTIITSKYSKTYNTNYIKWNKVSGATGYRVYRATSKNGKYTRLTTTKNLNFTDNNLKTGKTYYYKVRAYKTVKGAMVFGPYCDTFSITPKLATPKVNVYQYGISTKVQIGKVKDAKGYVIYRATSKDGKYTKIANTKNLLYKDAKITYTQGYYYKVRAYKVVGKKTLYSDYTTPVYIKTYVPRPTVYLTRQDTNKLKISWDKLYGCTGYEIYISEDNVNYTVIKDIKGYKTDNITTSNLELNKKYYIKARSYIIINGEKHYSKYSNVGSYTLNQFLQALKLKSNYNVRSKPSKSKTLGTVKKNQIIVSYGMEKNYHKVKINGKFGYIHKSYVTVYKDAKVLGLSNINQFSNQGGKMLPTGCEVTSLAVVLKYLGFNSVTKNILADKYQPRGAIGKTDPNVAFVGTPYSSKPYGCYAPVIVKTANNYFNAIGNKSYQVNDLTGMGIDNIYKEIDKGNPLIMWMTYGKPYKQDEWTFTSNTITTKAGEGTYKFTWYGLQHCVAVAGYNKNKNTLIIADVAKSGELTEYSISYLREGYNKLGKQVVSITKNK